MKKVLSLFLSLVMALSVLTSVPVTVNAASVDGLTVSLNSDDTSEEVVIPDTDYNHFNVFHSEVFKLWWTISFNNNEQVYEFSPYSIKYYTLGKFNLEDYYDGEKEIDYGYGTYFVRYYAIPADIFEGEALKHFNISDMDALRNDTNTDPVYNAETNTYDMPEQGGWGDSITYTTKGYKNIGNGTYEVYGYTVEMAYEKPDDAVEGVDYIMHNGYPAEILKCLRVTIEYNGTDVKFISWETISLDEVPSVQDLVHNHVPSDWIIDNKPTCTEKGSKHRDCTVCGAVAETIEIPATGHTTSSWKTDEKATVYKAGLKHKKCTVCKETLETEKIPQLKPGRTTVKASTTSSGIKITWSKVTGADKYTVYRKTGDGSYKAIKTVTGTSYTDTTAKSGTKYRYNVKAKNEAGYGEYAKSGVTKLFLATPKVTVSNALSGVTVKWNKITGAKGYYVYRKLSGSDSWTKIATVKSGTTVSFTDKKASAGKKYYYTVKAYNGDYVSTTKASSIIEFLKAPTLKSVTSGKSGVTVKWAKSTGADGYYVYRKEGSGSYKKISTVKGNSKVSYLDKSAKKGKTYTYYVKAYSGKSVSTSSKTLKIKDKY